MVTIEICVEDEAGAVAAIEGGADRIELCAALDVGGLTPTPALLARVLAHVHPAGVEVHAMVRPRSGDFAYDAGEVALAADEGAALLAAGADGLVFGACRDGKLDHDVLRTWIGTLGLPRPRLTLHRAIDLVTDLPGAVDEAVELGFGRILSSGGARTAMEGARTLRRMVAAAHGRCRIAAGSGVRAENVRELIGRTGVDHVHGSASAPWGDADPAVVALGFAAGPRRTTSRAMVEALCREARS